MVIIFIFDFCGYKVKLVSFLVPFKLFITFYILYLQQNIIPLLYHLIAKDLLHILRC